MRTEHTSGQRNDHFVHTFLLEIVRSTKRKSIPLPYTLNRSGLRASEWANCRCNGLKHKFQRTTSAGIGNILVEPVFDDGSVCNQKCKRLINLVRWLRNTTEHTRCITVSGYSIVETGNGILWMTIVGYRVSNPQRDRPGNDQLFGQTQQLAVSRVCPSKDKREERNFREEVCAWLTQKTADSHGGTESASPICLAAEMSARNDSLRETGDDLLRNSRVLIAAVKGVEKFVIRYETWTWLALQCYQNVLYNAH